MGVYQILETADKQTVFIYAVILLLSISLFKRRIIGLNIILGIFVAIVIIMYKSEQNSVKGDQAENIYNTKLQSIKPQPENLEKESNIIDFLFSVQELYNYNPQAYEELVDALDSFILLNDVIKEGDRFCENDYEIAVTKKHSALNALHSIIHTTPSEINFNNKFNRSLLALEEILNQYLDDMYKICDEKVINEGYNIERKIIDRGPKPSEYYKEKLFSYDFF
mgnify:CR=1 FL=1